MSIYTKQHYDSIADLLSKNDPSHPVMIQVKGICLDFANLFAADSPPICVGCGIRRGQNHHENHPDVPGRLFIGGFDREQFLTACGLKPEDDIEPEQADPRNLGFHQ